MLQYPTSVLAAAAICQSQRTLRRSEPETFLREIHKIVNAEVLDSCCRELQFLHFGSMKSSLQAVRKKYQASEFARIHCYLYCDEASRQGFPDCSRRR